MLMKADTIDQNKIVPTSAIYAGAIAAISVIVSIVAFGGPLLELIHRWQTRRIQPRILDSADRGMAHLDATQRFGCKHRATVLGGAGAGSACGRDAYRRQVELAVFP